MKAGIYLQRLEIHARDIILLEGFRRYGLAFLCGAVAALAQAPFDLLFVYFITFPPLILLLDGAFQGGRGGLLRSLGIAGGIGWSFGFGYFLAGLWWLGVAFITGGEEFIWLMPLGVVGLPACLALFPAFGFVLARFLWSGGGVRIFAFGLGTGVAEWLRATVFTGFPWNSFGQALANHPVLMQASSLIGSDSLGIMLVAAAATPALMLTESRRARVMPLVLAALLICALYAFGLARLSPVGGTRIDNARIESVPDVRLRLMQANISHAEMAARDAGARLLDRYLALSDRATSPERSGIQDITHLIWPESPFPFLLDREPRALGLVTRLLQSGTILITGAIRGEDAPAAPRGMRLFNAMQAYDRNGLVASYDKRHLVPFGEFLPFESYLRAMGFRQFVNVIGGFSAGTARSGLEVPGLPRLLPLICYEIIFPGEFDLREMPAELMLNITNDAWFGPTPGPYQHLAQARLRAVEFGLPVIRAANSGISAVIDPYGRIIGQTALGKTDILDAHLPKALSSTLYRQVIWFSYGAVMICFGLLSLAGLILPRR